MLPIPNVSRLCYFGFCAALLAACSQDKPQQQPPVVTTASGAQPPTDSAATMAAEATQRATDATARPVASASAAPVYRLLQGKWQSTIDTLDVVEFKNHDYIDYYDQKQLSKKTFQLDNACPGAKKAGAAGDNERYLVVDDMCWHIAMLDGSSLELEYIDGGKILTYSKLP